MGARQILHCNCNCFYASVEMQEQPRLRGKAIAVCGDPEARHGIVLTASYPAKRMEGKTDMAIWQAQQCAGTSSFFRLIIVNMCGTAASCGRSWKNTPTRSNPSD